MSVCLGEAVSYFEADKTEVINNIFKLNHDRKGLGIRKPILATEYLKHEVPHNCPNQEG